jgi:DNA repair protein RadD
VQPRYYQSECVDAIFNYFTARQGQPEVNPVNALPTGTGKSIIIAMLCQRALTGWPGTRILMLTHVKELIAQNYKKLLQLWPTAPIGIFSAGLRRRDIRPITYGGIGTVSGNEDAFGFVDFVIIDECHLVSHKEDTTYVNTILALKKVNPRLRVIGFSATPYRLGQGKLTDTIEKKDGTKIPALFTGFSYDVTGMDAFNKLIAEGFISPLIPRRTSKEIDLSGVHTIGNDFNQGELQAAVDKSEITYRCCKEMLELGADREHWLVFATGTDHADHVAETLQGMGASAYAVHSKMPGAERDLRIAAFLRGEVRCLVNNNVLTTGFDAPFIDLIGMLRPTISVSLWVQMLGRGTRPFEGKENCLVLDFAGNTKRLGPINDPVLPRKRGKKSGKAPVKICTACDTYNHPSVRFCTCCGQEFPKDVKLVAEASEHELIADGVPVVETLPVESVNYSSAPEANANAVA